MSSIRNKLQGSPDSKMDTLTKELEKQRKQSEEFKKLLKGFTKDLQGKDKKI